MRQFKITILLTLLMSMVGVEASASDIAVKNAYGTYIYYTWQNNNTELAVSYGGSNYSSSQTYSGNVVIPETVTYDGNTYSVTSIGEYAFYSCSGLTSVSIPNSVTKIEYDAFYGCSALTSVTIPNSVTSIGSYAFRNCSSLTSITIPYSVTRIEYTAFNGCSGLESIYVNSGNTRYDSRNNCKAIIETSSNRLILGCKNTVITNTVISIGENAFYGCSGLTSITIPNSVTSIGYGAFSGCI